MRWQFQTFSVDLCKNTDRTIRCMSGSFNIFLSDWRQLRICADVERRESGSVFSRADSLVVWYKYKAINGLVQLLSKLSDITCTCLALDPWLDILLTQSARCVNFLKWGSRQLISALAIKIKGNFCDHVSINKLSSMLTLLGKWGWFNSKWTM